MTEAEVLTAIADATRLQMIDILLCGILISLIVGLVVLRRATIFGYFMASASLTIVVLLLLPIYTIPVLQVQMFSVWFNLSFGASHLLLCVFIVVLVSLATVFYALCFFVGYHRAYYKARGIV